MPSSSPHGEPKKRVLPAFILQGSVREKLANDLVAQGAATSMPEAREAARGMFSHLNWK